MNTKKLLVAYAKGKRDFCTSGIHFFITLAEAREYV